MPPVTLQCIFLGCPFQRSRCTAYQEHRSLYPHKYTSRPRRLTPMKNIVCTPNASVLHPKLPGHRCRGSHPPVIPVLHVPFPSIEPVPACTVRDCHGQPGWHVDHLDIGKQSLLLLAAARKQKLQRKPLQAASRTGHAAAHALGAQVSFAVPVARKPSPSKEFCRRYLLLARYAHSMHDDIRPTIFSRFRPTQVHRVHSSPRLRRAEASDSVGTSASSLGPSLHRRSNANSALHLL